jgi:hypothetical protein
MTPMLSRWPLRRICLVDGLADFGVFYSQFSIHRPQKKLLQRFKERYEEPHESDR